MEMIKKGSLVRFNVKDDRISDKAPLYAQRKGTGGKILTWVPNGAIVMTLTEHASSYYSYPAHWIIYEDMVGWVAGWLSQVPESEQ